MLMPQQLDARDVIIAEPASTLLALDFDGTLAHIVDDPTQAYAHERAVSALARLGQRLGHLAIITGRPVDQALQLGGFAGRDGLERLQIFGQYGLEHWDASSGTVVKPPRPVVMVELASALPAWLAEHNADGVRIEDKGLAIALHTRGLDPSVLKRLSSELSALAAHFGLDLEPGRQVVELRTAVIDKGDVLRQLVFTTGARQVIFGGDDLGDLPAFRVVRELEADGLIGLLLCSASGEQDALIDLADIVLDGPDAVAGWLESLADEL